MADYYTPGTPAVKLTLARAENIAAELVTIKASFDKIPEQLSLEQGRQVYALDTGAANAYLVALPATLAAYTTGLNILMKAVNVNTGPSTLNVDGLGVQTLTRLNGDALVAGDIPADGMIELFYDGTNFQIKGTETPSAALLNILEDVTPQLGAQLDVNGFGLGDGTLELLTFTEVASAINHVNVKNNSVGLGPVISAVGDDTNIDLQLRSKGSGETVIADDVGNQIMRFADVASAVNELQVTNAATGGNPSIQATGSDTDIDVNFASKGTGTVQANGTEIVRRVLPTEVATTSVTSVTISSIPSWVKKIHIMLAGVGTDGTSGIILQIGDSGGIEITGYSTSISSIISATAASATANSAFVFTTPSDPDAAYDGVMTLVLASEANDVWVMTSTVARDDGTATVFNSAGRKGLDTALTQLKLTTFNGTDTFDEGAINIMYE